MGTLRMKVVPKFYERKKEMSELVFMESRLTSKE